MPELAVLRYLHQKYIVFLDSSLKMSEFFYNPIIILFFD